MSPGASILLLLDVGLAILVIGRGVGALAGGRPVGVERAALGLSSAGLLLVFLDYARSTIGPAGRAYFQGASAMGGRADAGLVFVSGLLLLAGCFALEIAEKLALARSRVLRAGRWLATSGAVALVAFHVVFVVAVGEVLAIQESLREPFVPVEEASPSPVPLGEIGGYPALRVEIEGRPVDLIVDTGSEGTILAGRIAREELELAPFLWTRLLPVSVHFPLYDRTVPASIHRVERLGVGPFRFERTYLPSAGFEDFLGLDQEVQGFVGMDLLGNLVSTFDRRRGVLVLSSPGRTRPPAGAIVLEVEVVGGRILLPVWIEVDGRQLVGRYRFLFDTGVGQTIVDPDLLPEQGRLRLRFDHASSHAVGMRYRVRQLDEFDGIVGHDLLDANRVTIDPSRRRVWLEPYR